MKECLIEARQFLLHVVFGSMFFHPCTSSYIVRVLLDDCKFTSYFRKMNEIFRMMVLYEYFKKNLKNHTTRYILNDKLFEINEVLYFDWNIEKRKYAVYMIISAKRNQHVLPH